MKLILERSIFYFCTLVGTALWILSSKWLSEKFDIPFIVVALTIAGIIWLFLEFLIRKMLKNVHDDKKIVFCNLSDCVNETDFEMDDEHTLMSLSDIGETPASAVGKVFPMYGETLEGNVFFTGTIVTENSKYYIRRLSEFQS